MQVLHHTHHQEEDGREEMTTSPNEEQRPAQAEREELTEEERARLSGGVDWSAGEHAGRKALRIIDRDAADRAALVARVAELEAEAKAERDSAREFARRVRELVADDNAWRAEAAEARVRELETEAALDTEHRLACEWKARYEAERAERSVTKDRLAARAEAAEGLPGRIWEALGELTSYLVDGDHMVKVDDVRHTFERHLSAQPTARDRLTARAEAEQRVLDACDGAVIEWVQAGARTARLSVGSSQSVAEAVLARREGVLRG
jgi:hypothetical protein